MDQHNYPALCQELCDLVGWEFKLINDTYVEIRFDKPQPIVLWSGLPSGGRVSRIGFDLNAVQMNWEEVYKTLIQYADPITQPYT